MLPGRTVLLFDSERWRAAWWALASHASDPLNSAAWRAWPPAAPLPALAALPPTWWREELPQQREVASLSPERQRRLEEHVASDPFLLRAPASWWQRHKLPAPCEALRLEAPILLLKKAAEGTPVSYGHHYTMPRAGTLATVAVGYGDGYKRAFSNRAMMQVAGEPAPVVGRVCMDQSILDLSGHAAESRVRMGDAVLAAGGPRREDRQAGCDFISLSMLADMPLFELIGGLAPRVEPLRVGLAALEPIRRTA